MDRRYIIIGITAFVFLFVSCGQKHKAKVLVEDFIENYAIDPDAIAERDFTRFDSTKVITDSLIMAMQEATHPLYKHPIPYSVHNAGRMLFLLRMNYQHQGDTLWQTFYVDEQMEHVVAFK